MPRRSQSFAPIPAPPRHEKNLCTGRLYGRVDRSRRSQNARIGAKRFAESHRV